MKIITAIASTTHVDRQNERMSKEALDGMAEQIRNKFIPYLIEHDPQKLIGVILEGKVLPLSDGEFALFIVSGIFEDEQDLVSYKIGSPNNIWGKYSIYLDNVNTKIIESNNVLPKKIGDQNIADLLENHLDATSIWIDGSVYHIKHFIARTGDLEIRVYPKDHYPDHFHVVSKQRGINARFNLDNLELMKGSKGYISLTDEKKIRDFFEKEPCMLDKLRNEYKKMQK